MQNVYFPERTFDSDARGGYCVQGMETTDCFLGACGARADWLCFLLTREGMLSDALLAGIPQSIVRC